MGLTGPPAALSKSSRVAQVSAIPWRWYRLRVTALQRAGAARRPSPPGTSVRTRGFPSVLTQLRTEWPGRWPLDPRTSPLSQGTGGAWVSVPNGPQTGCSLSSMTGHSVAGLWGRPVDILAVAQPCLPRRAGHCFCQWLLDLRTGSSLKTGQRNITYLRRGGSACPLVSHPREFRELTAPFGCPVLLASTALCS